ncbi:MAG: PilZ domain-containing protein [Deltaproteobacteria bacterium]|nr:PilZ domain-containing protein [Deltaproteobacteria bacterium]
MERRKFPRHDVKDVPLKAILILNGGSLLKADSPSAIEITTQAIDLSRGGISVALQFDAQWEILSTTRSMDLVIEKDGIQFPTRGHVVRRQARQNLLGLEFESPLRELTAFL